MQMMQKIYSTISSANDSDCLQRVIDRVKHWCDEWLLPLNINSLNAVQCRLLL